MTVKELIDSLKKLPPNNEVYANVLGEEMAADIIGVAGHYSGGGVSTILVDRSRQLARNLQKIEDKRNEWNIGVTNNERMDFC